MLIRKPLFVQFVIKKNLALLQIVILVNAIININISKGAKTETFQASQYILRTILLMAFRRCGKQVKTKAIQKEQDQIKAISFFDSSVAICSKVI